MDELTLANIATNCTCASVSRVARIVTQLFDDALKPSGLSAGQMTLLVALAVAGEATVRPLAERLMMDRSTLTRNLQPLLRDGLVEVRRGADRRQRIIRLTAHGRQAVERAVPLWEKSQQSIVAYLGVEGWQALMGQLTDLTEIALIK